MKTILQPLFWRVLPGPSQPGKYLYSYLGTWSFFHRNWDSSYYCFQCTRVRSPSILNKHCSFSFPSKRILKSKYRWVYRDCLSEVLMARNCDFLRKQNLLSFEKRFWKAHIRTWNELMLKFLVFCLISIQFCPHSKAWCGKMLDPTY